MVKKYLKLLELYLPQSIFDQNNLSIRPGVFKDREKLMDELKRFIFFYNI